MIAFAANAPPRPSTYAAMVGRKYVRCASTASDAANAAPARDVDAPSWGPQDLLSGTSGMYTAMVVGPHTHFILC